MYTEEEIVELAKKHISGGTQLYLHTLTSADIPVLFVVDNNPDKLTYANYNQRVKNIISVNPPGASTLICGKGYSESSKIYYLSVEWFGSYGSLSQSYTIFDEDTVTPL